MLFVVLAAFARPHTASRWIAGVLATISVLMAVGAGVNGHFAYYRTLGSVFGKVPGNVVDEADLAGLCQNDDSVRSEGFLVNKEIPGEKSSFDAQEAWIYLPPAWCVEGGDPYPVIVLLHGTPSVNGTKDWIVGGEANKAADAFAADHDGRAPVLIMADSGGSNDTECVDSEAYGNVETYLSEDVPAFASDDPLLKGRVNEKAEGWAIAGLSERGTCALMLTLRHPDVFRSFGNYSGSHFGVGDGESQADEKAYHQHDPSKLMKGGDLSDLGGWFEVGAEDRGTEDEMRTYVDQAVDADMSVCFSTVPNAGHTFTAFAPSFRDSLPWLAARAGLVPMSDAVKRSCETP